MASLLRPDLSVGKQKAVQDAAAMQAAVRDECARAGKPAPPYELQELIGKGSFGRVYKAADTNRRAATVAVKIIDIEGSDTVNPKLADTYSEFLKEISALKLLSESGARNINHVLDVLPVGESMWMVTEYCAGGSVATLMKPTAPGGLQEKWIVPILREVAEAVFWVHRQGIIHRDIKCANVLVTEAGGVQLCDFGVAGVIETKFDKRSTFIGTPHWMAPELFDPAAAYGTEVDIWAFGSLVFEIASGLPPNVMAGVDITNLGHYLKTHTPRLEGDRYSDEIKDLAAFCLAEDPAARPTIEDVQHHPYLFNTAEALPTSSLADLVRAYKVWEARGGSRKSLFAAGGAQGPVVGGGDSYSSTALANDEWNFSTTVDFDRLVLDNPDAQAVYDVYGHNIDFEFNEQTARPPKPNTNSKNRSRRRPPPHLPVLKAPLEKVFDPHTISNYQDNSRLYYNKPPPPPPPPPAAPTDLPLRDDSFQSTLRESLIDLDASLHGSDLSQFAAMDTIRASQAEPQAASDWDDDDYHHDRAPLSDPADLNNNRRTQEWKFPVAATPASANPEMSRFPFDDANGSTRSSRSSSNSSDRVTSRRPAVTPGVGGRPPLVHHPTEPILSSPRVQDSRASVGSLIDLDEGLVDMPPPPEDDATARRPSTAGSDVVSVSGSDVSGTAGNGYRNNPFDLERHASVYAGGGATREPSIYVSDDSDFARLARAPDEEPEAEFDDGGSDPSASSSRMHSRASSYGDGYSTSGHADSDYLTMGGNYRQPRLQAEQQQQQPLQQLLQQQQPILPQQLPQQLPQHLPQQHPPRRPVPRGRPRLPPVPSPPSARVMQGIAGRDEVRDDMTRMLASFADHLRFANAHLAGR